MLSQAPTPGEGKSDLSGCEGMPADGEVLAALGVHDAWEAAWLQH